MFPQSTAARQPYRVLEVLLHPAQGAAGGTQQGRLRGSQVCTMFARASILQIGSHFLISLKWILKKIYIFNQKVESQPQKMVLGTLDLIKRFVLPNVFYWENTGL